MKKTDITEDIAKELIRKIDEFKPEMEAKRVGTVLSVGDGVARISGLPSAQYLELLEFSGGIQGLAINLEEGVVGVVILGDYVKIHEGDEVRTTGKLLSVPVTNDLLGRVIDPLGQSIDGKGSIKSTKQYPLEKIAPSVVYRQAVDTPLQTGIKAIDALIPIGRGQRELIIGDRNTGKTAVAIDTIINQKNENVICIYVAIGQKMSRIAHVVSDLTKFRALDHTIVVSASASDPVSYQYIAPYTGCAIAEYFMDQKKDVLIVYDDLSKHAWAYRQISLILRRPSGREAYPGDVFYLHSRLLERACRMNDKYGGGSITALPIIETLANDISAYIPTNVISITDGQIYLEPDLFYAGQRPALNVGISVSRVGSAAQIKAMKKVAGNLRIDLAQYRALAAFAQFSTDVDEATRKQIDRGSRILELLKQGQYAPVSVEKQVAILWAGVNGFLDDIPLEQVSDFEKKYLSFIDDNYQKLLTKISKEKTLSEDIVKSLTEAVNDFKKEFIKET